jgi:hypothetical protein
MGIDGVENGQGRPGVWDGSRWGASGQGCVLGLGGVASDQGCVLGLGG